jgi:predicted metal-binding transcription factor (methanogenesis marker protein 9)
VPFKKTDDEWDQAVEQLHKFKDHAHTSYTCKTMEDGKIVEKMKEDVLDTNQFVPYPEEYAKKDEIGHEKNLEIDRLRWAICQIQKKANKRPDAVKIIAELDEKLKEIREESDSNFEKILQIDQQQRNAGLTKKEQDEIAKLTKEMTKYFGYKDGFNSGGYQWCCANWGSKWGICRAELKKEYKTFEGFLYTFESPWAAPFPLIREMSVMFPLLKFELRYYERGMQFQGLYVCQDGEEIIAEEKKYHGMRGG